MLLLIAQCNQWIDPRRPACRDVTSEDRDDRQKQRDATVDEWIVSTDSEAQAGTEARSCESSQHTQNQSSDCQPQSLTHHETQDATRLRRHRHANTDFARWLVHRL